MTTVIDPATLTSIMGGGGDEIISAEEAAALLKVSERTVRRLAREGQLRGRMVGREWRFSRRDVVAYVTDAPRDEPPAGEPRACV